MSVSIQQCTTCRHRWFPDRLICPSCGTTDFVRESAEHCRIEQITSLADGSTIATVRVADEVPLIVRLLGDASVHDIVALTTRPDVDGPAAFLPIPSSPSEASR